MSAGTHEQHGIRDLVLTDPSPEYDHARLFRPYAHVVQPSDIAYDVDDQSRVLVGVKVDHVAQ